MNTYELLKETLKNNREKYLKPLNDLLAIDTHVLGHGIAGGLEKEGQLYLGNLVTNMGAEVKYDPMSEEVIKKALQTFNEGNLGHNYNDRENLYATFDFGGNKTIMFNGHMDVMPADNVSEWTNNPFTPTTRDGKIYARGSADMKAGVMAAVMAVQLLKDAGLKPKNNVKITSVCDEEGGGNGSIQAAMNGEKADICIVCEGTSDELILAHMGFIFFKITVKGVACHSGNKKEGVSAIEKAIKYINALNELEHNWLLNYKHPLLPAPNLNVGVIKGGENGSTVPDRCEFSICVHYLPNFMTHDGVVKEILDALDRVNKSDKFLQSNPCETEIYQMGGGFEMPIDDNVKSFINAYENLHQRKLNIVGSPAGCDSRIWRNIANIPTIQFGPGHLYCCHATDEWVSVEDYLDSVLIYANFIMSY